MSESNKKLARKIFEEIWNQGALPLADELYDADYVAHISHHPEAIRGVEAFKQFVALFQALHQVNYGGYVTVELYPYEEEPIQAAEEAYRFLSPYLAG